MNSILAILGFLACASLIIRALNIRSNSSKAAPNHQIALDFFENNPTYPMDREKVTINCPITLDISDSPVCISYDYENKTYSHAYDYNALTEWFKTENGKSCPVTKVSLLEVKNFTMSFDIPDNVPEKLSSSSIGPVSS